MHTQNKAVIKPARTKIGRFKKIIWLAIVLFVIFSLYFNVDWSSTKPPDGSTTAQASEIPRGGKQFIVMKKERRPTAWFEPGERKRIWSDKPFYGLSFQERFNKPDTAIRYEMGPGWSCWYYDNYPGNEGYLIAEGIEDSTTLRIFPSQ